MLASVVRAAGKASVSLVPPVAAAGLRASGCERGLEQNWGPGGGGKEVGKNSVSPSVLVCLCGDRTPLWPQRPWVQRRRMYFTPLC